MAATQQKIDLQTKYIPLMDEAYRLNARSSILEAADNMVRATEDANVVKINKFECDGLGTYNKNKGAPMGAIISEWETWTFTNDRGRQFAIDKIDNLENLGMAFLGMTSQFMKQKVIPEKDAYTFAKIASTSGVKGTTGTLTTANIRAAIDDAKVELANNEVDESSMVLFITPAGKSALETAINRSLASGIERFNQKINYYDDIPLITVPPTRFYDKIDLFDGTTTGEEKGGYAKASDGVGINFILMDRNAALTVSKNAVVKVFTPEENQIHDGWSFHYRFYYDTFLYDNKKAGIYVHKLAAASGS